MLGRFFGSKEPALRLLEKLSYEKHGTVFSQLSNALLEVMVRNSCDTEISNLEELTAVMSQFPTLHPLVWLSSPLLLSWIGFFPTFLCLI